VVYFARPAFYPLFACKLLFLYPAYHFWIMIKHNTREQIENDMPLDSAEHRWNYYRSYLLAVTVYSTLRLIASVGVLLYSAEVLRARDADFIIDKQVLGIDYDPIWHPYWIFPIVFVELALETMVRIHFIRSLKTYWYMGFIDESVSIHE
jgi:hypothetical protein